MSSECVHNIDKEESQLHNEQNNDINKWFINKEFISDFNDEHDDYSSNPLTAALNKQKII